MTFPLPASPASIKTDLPPGATIRIESPSIGPTSSTCTCSSPVGFGGSERSRGKPHFQNAAPPAPSRTTSTAMAQPHPLVERFNIFPPAGSPAVGDCHRIYSRPSSLWERHHFGREHRRAELFRNRPRARSFRFQLLHR